MPEILLSVNSAKSAICFLVTVTLPTFTLPSVAAVWVATTASVDCAYASSTSVCAAITAERVSAIICLLRALSIYPVSAGTSSAAKIARMTRTTISSTRVKPFLSFSFFEHLVFLQIFLFYTNISAPCRHFILSFYNTFCALSSQVVLLQLVLCFSAILKPKFYGKRQIYGI